MRLVMDCEHGQDQPHTYPKSDIWCWPRDITDPDAILAALAEAGVLEVRRYNVPNPVLNYEAWKEAK